MARIGIDQEKAAVAARRVKVAELYLDGWIQTEIAGQMDVDQATISRDLKAIMADWKEAARLDMEELRARELAKLAKTYRDACDGWKRSVQDAVKAETVETDSPGKDGKGKKSTRKKGSRQGQAGDPQFLRIKLECIKRWCEIYGLDAAKEVNHTGAIKFYAGFTLEDVTGVPAPGGVAGGGAAADNSGDDGDTGNTEDRSP